MDSQSKIISWPQDTSYQAFKLAWPLKDEEIWETMFTMHQDKMQIKNLNVAVSKLENIINSTFQLSAEKGFQAMSLRDLSKKTGLSMGGLYSYIGSKNDLASIIESVLRHYIQLVLGDLGQQELGTKQYLRALVHAELYLNDRLQRWFYFSFMEAKGLPIEQQQELMGLELLVEEMFARAIRKGVDEGVFVCDVPDIVAVNFIAVIQQWYLKRWKFKRMQMGVEEFAKTFCDSLIDWLCVVSDSEPDPQIPSKSGALSGSNFTLN